MYIFNIRRCFVYVQQHVYKDLPYTGPISAVQYHPFDHFLVIGSSEPNSKECLITKKIEF